MGFSTTLPRQKDCKQPSQTGYALDLVLSDLPQDDGSNQTVSDATCPKGNSFVLIQELENEINVLESELKASKAETLDSTKRLVEAKSTKVALQETLARLERTARKPRAVAAIEADIIVQRKKAAFLLASSTAGPESLSSSSSHKVRACQAIVQQHEAELSRLAKERNRCSSGDAVRRTPAIATIEAAIFVQRQKEAFLLASSTTGELELSSPSSSSQKVRACQAIVQKLEAELARLTKDNNGDAVGLEQRNSELPMERDRVLFEWNDKKLYTIDEVKAALEETEQTVSQLEDEVMAQNQSSADHAAKALQLASRIVNELAKVAASQRHGETISSSTGVDCSSDMPSSSSSSPQSSSTRNSYVVGKDDACTMEPHSETTVSGGSSSDDSDSTLMRNTYTADVGVVVVTTSASYEHVAEKKTGSTFLWTNSRNNNNNNNKPTRSGPLRLRRVKTTNAVTK
jgi:hypothetical protein